MKRFVVLIAIVVVLALGWSAVWLYIAGRVEAEVAALAQADGVTAPRLTCAELSVRGFPFRFDVHCTEAQVASGDIAVDLAGLSATVLVYRPTHILLFAEGPARITDAFNGTVQGARWDELRGSVRLENDRLARASFEASGLAYLDMLLGEEMIASAESAELHLVDNQEAAGDNQDETSAIGDAALSLYARVLEAEVPALDITRGAAVVEAHATGLPDLAFWGHPDILRLWQAGDGQITLSGLDAEAEGVRLAASGEARLDEAGQVNGALEVTSQGVVERMGDLADDPVARLVLGNRAEDGSYSQSVSVRGGTVYVGILPLQRLPALF